MNEKIYSTVSRAGIASLVLGIISVVFGVAAGILMIIHGAMLLKEKGKMMI